MDMDASNTVGLAAESADSYYRRELDVANHTGLTILDGRSPAHFKHWVENPDQDNDTEALAFGKAFHCATLEPDVFDKTYTVLPANAPARPGRRSWEAKAPSRDMRLAMDWWSNFEHATRGKVIVTASDYERVRRMAESIQNHSAAVAGLLVGGKREHTFRWRDEETGVRCKARVDNYESGEFMLDLKKTRDASFEAFARSITSYRYDQQAAHYTTGARICDRPVPRYIILACEDVPPYVCQPYFLDPMAEERGFNLRRRAIRKQAQCLNTGIWPGYSTRFEQISLPTFAYFGIEETTR